MDTARLQADLMLDELTAQPAKATTMGKLQRVSYTHDAMIDLMISHPEWSKTDIAKHFGYSPSWISNIWASDAFQARYAERRTELVNPTLQVTLEENFRAMTYESLRVLKEKLEQPACPAEVALRAAEMGAKALGLGGHRAVVPPAPPPNRLEQLAGRLIALQRKVVGQEAFNETVEIQFEVGERVSALPDGQANAANSGDSA